MADATTVPKTHTVLLPTYSVERYYMLSQIEQASSSIQFLQENDDNDHEPESFPSFTTSSCPNMNNKKYIIVYLLWKDGADDVRSFYENQILTTLQQVSKELSLPTNQESKSESLHVYLCIDKFIPPPPSSSTTETRSKEEGKEENQPEQQYYEQQTEMAKELAKYTISTLVKCVITKDVKLHGMVVGTTSHVRAAPALEICLRGVEYGSKERRLQLKGINIGNNSNKGPKLDDDKSPIYVVAPTRQDLIGLDTEGETDAVQGVYQTLTTSAPANATKTMAQDDGHVENNEDELRLLYDGINQFAKEAMNGWRHTYGLQEISIEDEDGNSDSMNNWIKLAIGIALIAYLWMQYGEPDHNRGGYA